MAQLPFSSATELVAAVRAKEISCIELLDCYLGRIEEFNPGLGAVVTVDAVRRLSVAADEAADGVGHRDRQAAEGELAQTRADHGLAGKPSNGRAAGDQRHRCDH